MTEPLAMLHCQQAYQIQISFSSMDFLYCVWSSTYKDALLHHSPDLQQLDCYECKEMLIVCPQHDCCQQ